MLTITLSDACVAELRNALSSVQQTPAPQQPQTAPPTPSVVVPSGTGPYSGLRMLAAVSMAAPTQQMRTNANNAGTAQAGGETAWAQVINNLSYNGDPAFTAAIGQVLNGRPVADVYKGLAAQQSLGFTVDQLQAAANLAYSLR